MNRQNEHARVRSTVKAIVTDNGRVLLNRCRDALYGDYYAFPGGGQNHGEALEDAVRREVLEETGYTVEPTMLAAVLDSIHTSDEYIRLFPRVTHKLMLVFRCELTDSPLAEPSEPDKNQLGVEWVEISRLREIELYPVLLRERLFDVLECTQTLFLGVNRD